MQIRSYYRNQKAYLLRLALIDLRDSDEEVYDSATVAELVVIPRDELNEVIVERDTRFSIESRRSCVADKIGGAAKHNKC